MSKEPNNFRSRNGERVSALEKMKALYRRKTESKDSTGRLDSVLIGLYGLLQTIYNSKSYRMDNKSLILDNVAWASLVIQELNAAGSQSQREVEDLPEANQLPMFKFKDALKVVHIDDLNIVCLEPCPR